MSRVPWSNLPRELLSRIAKCLPTRTDLRHFRAVCSSWRNSTPLPPKTGPYPSLKLPFPLSPTIRNRNRNRHYSIAESVIYCIQPLHKITNTRANQNSWFIKVYENATDDKMLLLDPFSDLQIHKFPKTMLNPFNSLDYKVTAICKEFGLACNFHIEDSKFGFVRKVVTSSTTVVDDNFMVFVLLLYNELSVWKMGDEMWTKIDHQPQILTRYHDVEFYKGKFYVVIDNGRVLLIDSMFLVTEIASDVGQGPLSSKHLVVSFGELFLFERCYNYGTQLGSDDLRVYWKVYKLNEEENDWVLVNSLGDRAFFVGCRNSFSVTAQDFPGCKGNSIYFVDDAFCKRQGHTPGYNGGIYDLEDGSVGPLSAFPGSSKIFWPPPTWLKRDAR